MKMFQFDRYLFNKIENLTGKTDLKLKNSFGLNEQSVRNIELRTEMYTEAKQYQTRLLFPIKKNPFQSPFASSGSLISQ